MTTQKTYVYETTNKINGMIYVGIHFLEERDPIHDGYLGSGDRIIRAVKKYGKENFKKRIIGVYDTRQEAMLIEQQIVTPEFIKDEKTYNIIVGGNFCSSLCGELHPSWGKKHTKESLKIMSEKKRGKNHPNWGKPRSEETKRKIGLANKGKKHTAEMRHYLSICQKGEKHHLYGKTLPESTKRKMRETALKRPKTLCPFCLRKFDPGNYARFHGGNCKKKLSSISKIC